MKAGLLGAALAAATSFVAALSTGQAATIYTYTGNPYNFIQDQDPPTGTYDNTMFVTASFTLAAPLAANLFLQDVGADVLNFSFSDGRRSITNSNVDGFQFVFSTDPSGVITDWNVGAGKGSPYSDPEGLQISTASLSFSNYFLDVGTIQVCATFVNGNCISTNYDGGATFNDPATWSFTTDPTATPLPAALPLFATGLGTLGLLGWRRKRKQVA